MPKRSNHFLTKTTIMSDLIFTEKVSFNFKKETAIHPSSYWYQHFNSNIEIKRVNWQLAPQISEKETDTILRSLQAWQLGETSEGKNLLRASQLYANKIDDLLYVDVVKLFIKEEQKHGNNLGKYLDLIGQPRIQKDWGDSLFRKVRYFNTSMELWTMAVIVVESTAQIFYQSLKDATQCTLLKQICTDILIDEAAHITFQHERLHILFQRKSKVMKYLTYFFYSIFFHITIMTVWFAHKKVFKAGGNTMNSYRNKMKLKFKKTIGRLFAK